jgi:hypothetical protein
MVQGTSIQEKRKMPLLLVCLISGAVFDASRLQFCLDVFRNPPLNTHGVHASYILGYSDAGV